MPVVNKAVAPASRNIDIGGYGSRVALRLPGTTWIDFHRDPANDFLLVIPSEAKQSISPCGKTGVLRRSPPPAKRRGGVGGGGTSANSLPAEQTDRPPTPDLESELCSPRTPPRARARGGRGDHLAQLRYLAACHARVLALAFRPLRKEGAGNAGRPMRPIAACAEIVGVSAHALSGHTGITRHSPRNGFTAYFVLSRAIGLFCHPHRQRWLPA